MPYIIATLGCPSHKINEVVKKFLEIRGKYPADSSLGEQVAGPATATKDGVKHMRIIEVKEGKLEEAFKREQSFCSEFFNIEGFEFSLEVWSTFAEAVAAAGVELPE